MRLCGERVGLGAERWDWWGLLVNKGTKGEVAYINRFIEDY